MKEVMTVMMLMMMMMVRVDLQHDVQRVLLFSELDAYTHCVSLAYSQGLTSSVTPCALTRVFLIMRSCFLFIFFTLSGFRST